MGNQQTNNMTSCPGSASNSSSNLVATVRKSARSSRLRMAELWELRRRSVGNPPMDAAVKKTAADEHNNYRSFTYGQSPSHSTDTGEEQGSSSEAIVSSGIRNHHHRYRHQQKPPRIEINGVNNAEKEDSRSSCSKCSADGDEKAPINDDKIASSENVEKPQEKEGTQAAHAQLGTPPPKSPLLLDQRRGSGSSLPSYSKHRCAQKVDSRKIAARKRLERGQTMTTTTTGPAVAVGGHYNKNPKTTGNNNNSKKHPLMASLRASDLLARSLDHQVQIKYSTDICMEMKPLSVRRTAHSVSPLLHQQRRFFGSAGGGPRGSLLSSTSFSGDDSVLNREQSDAVQHSWQLAKERIRQFAGTDRCFGFFAFDRIFERAPELKPLFGIPPSLSLMDIDEQAEAHPFISRHTRIFNNILDLAVRNAAELETEMFPAMFTYGQRHFRPKIVDQFNERTVRLFCSQVVGTMCDLLDEELSAFAQEAWIEMVTFLGRALLSGFEHERQQLQRNGKRFSLQKIH